MQHHFHCPRSHLTVLGPEGPGQAGINPDICNPLSPEEVAIKSIAPDIWGEGDKGQSDEFQRDCKTEKEISLTMSASLEASQAGTRFMVGR